MIINSVADLRAKLLADQKKQKAIAKIITHDIKLKLSEFTLKACETCDLVHELDARIKQISVSASEADFCVRTHANDRICDDGRIIRRKTQETQKG